MQVLYNGKLLLLPSPRPDFFFIHQSKSPSKTSVDEFFSGQHMGSLRPHDDDWKLLVCSGRLESCTIPSRHLLGNLTKQPLPSKVIFLRNVYFVERKKGCLILHLGTNYQSMWNICLSQDDSYVLTHIELCHSLSLQDLMTGSWFWPKRRSVRVALTTSGNDLGRYFSLLPDPSKWWKTTEHGFIPTTLLNYQKRTRNASPTLLSTR